MPDPEIADKKPYIVELDLGSYAWCSCGKSKNQPYCDGAHAGSDWSPKVFKQNEKKTVALCNCKHTKNPPYCDGSHARL